MFDGCTIVGGTAVGGASVEDVVTCNKGGASRGRQLWWNVLHIEGVLSMQASIIVYPSATTTNPYIYGRIIA
jgi:hypothetical protein